MRDTKLVYKVASAHAHQGLHIGRGVRLPMRFLAFVQLVILLGILCCENRLITVSFIAKKYTESLPLQKCGALTFIRLYILSTQLVCLLL